MKRWAEAGVRVAAGLVLTCGLIAASRVEVGRPDERALLRIDLRLDRGSVETCRDRTAAELDALPAHMRLPRLCERHPVAWRLRVELAGRLAVDELLVGAGARGDRPPTLDLELPVEPGPVDLVATLEPVVPADVNPAVRAAVAELPSAEVRARVDFERGRIVLLAFDGEADVLRLVEPSRADAPDP